MDGLNLNNQLDKKTQLLISKMEKEIELKDSEIYSKNNEIESKDKEIQNLKTELAFLKNQILSKNRKIFGKSSEQVDSNQISIFDDAEKNSDSKVVKPTIEEIVYTRTKSSKHTGKKDNLANLERIIVEHKLEENEAICSKCNNPLVVIGRKSKEVLKYIPAKLYIEEHITYSYACKSCEAEAGVANIISTKSPNTIFYKSMASNELVAHVINMKYQHAMPLYRLEAYFKMLGVNLSRQTLSNWIMNSGTELQIVYDIMKEQKLYTS